MKKSVKSGQLQYNKITQETEYYRFFTDSKEHVLLSYHFIFAPSMLNDTLISYSPLKS